MKIKAFVFDAYGTLYDVQSVSHAVNAAFPGYGEYITQIWRLKQLEYSWLRSLMGRYEDFLTVSRESLTYTLDTLGLTAETGVLESCVEELFAPALKAHPAFSVPAGELDALAERLAAAGGKVDWDDALPGVRRFYTADPWGNRIEILST